MALINPARNLADNAKIQEAFSIVDASTLQRMKGTDPDTESQLLDHVQRFSSSLVLAHLVDASRRTIKKKLSLLAFILIVYKRVMNQLAILGLDQAMSRQVGRDRIKPLYFATKYKYDEMSMKVSSKSEKGAALKAATTKVLQLSVS